LKTARNVRIIARNTSGSTVLNLNLFKLNRINDIIAFKFCKIKEEFFNLEDLKSLRSFGIYSLNDYFLSKNYNHLISNISIN